MVNVRRGTAISSLRRDKSGTDLRFQLPADLLHSREPPADHSPEPTLVSASAKSRLFRGLTPPRTARIAAALALVAVLPFPARGAAPSEREIGATLGEITRGLDLQLDLPRVAEPYRWNLTLPPGLFWVIVAVIVAVLLLAIAQYIFDEILPLLGITRRRLPRPGAAAGEGDAFSAVAAEALAVRTG
jgi:hypothetical protein